MASDHNLVGFLIIDQHILRLVTESVGRAIVGINASLTAFGSI